MRNRITLICLMFSGFVGLAQSPDLINYQGVMRNAAGVPLVNRNFSIRFELRQGSATGSTVFQEDQNLITNKLGLFNTQIGSIDPSALQQVNWQAADMFLAVSVDTLGGTEFKELGVQRLVSVPYALNARNAESVASSFTNNVLSIGANVYTLSSGTAYSEGQGISITGTVISNTAPDQTVTLQGAGNNVQVTGAYPDFTVASTPSLTHNNGELSISDGNTVSITPSVNIQNNILSVGPVSNSVQLPSVQPTTITASGAAVVTPTAGHSFTLDVATPTITGAGITTVTGSYPSFVVNTASPSITGSGASTVTGTFPNYVINTASANITATGASTVSGVFPNYVINTASTAITGAGIATVSGTFPNYVVNTASPNITGSGASSVSGTFPNYVINTPSTAVTGAGIATVTGAFPNYVVNTASPNITGSGATTVSGTYPNYNVNTPSTNISGTGATTVSGAFPNYVVNTPSTNLTGTGATTVSGTFPNYVVGTPSTSIVGGGVTTVSGAYPNFTVNTPLPPTATVVGTGMALVTPSTGMLFTVNVPTLTYNNSTGVLTSGVNNTTVAPVLSYTNGILRSGPGTNSVSITESPWTRTLNAVIPTSSTITGVAIGPVLPGVVTGSSKYLTLSSTSVYAGTSAAALEIQGSSGALAAPFGKIDFLSSGLTAPASNVARIAAYRGGATNEGMLGFSTSDGITLTERMYIDENGLVGIGTSNPAANLHIETGGNSRMYMVGGATGVLNLSFGHTVNPNMGNIRYDNNSNSFNFWTNNTADRLFINDNGQIGIGSTNVGGYNVTIDGAASNTSSLRFRHNSSTGLGFVIGNNTSGTSLLSYENTPLYFGIGGANLMSLQPSGEFRVGNNTTTFSDVGLLVSRAGNFNNRLVITGGDNSNSYGGILTFAENQNMVNGMSLKLDAVWNRLMFTTDMNGSSPIMAVNGYGSTPGVLIGNGYVYSTPPLNGLIVEGSMGIGINNPIYKLQVRETTAFGRAINGENNYVGNSDGRGITGYAINNPGYGYGGYFTGGYHGVFGEAQGSTYTGSVFGLRGAANSSSGTSYALYGGASGGLSAYGLYATASGATTNYAGYFSGNVHVAGTLSKSAGTFKIDHPQDPANKYLIHSFVESPDMMNVYNGNVTTNGNGDATVVLPSYFEAENIDFKYQLTVIGQFAQAIVFSEISNNSFVIKTDKPNVKVSWQVTGVRNDEFARQNRVVPEVEKNGADRGKYLNPEVYGLPASAGIHAPPQEDESRRNPGNDK